ncbi:MAG: hypothetical protein QM756_30100 [Polyangiaceae bacterium]
MRRSHANARIGAEADGGPVDEGDHRLGRRGDGADQPMKRIEPQRQPRRIVQVVVRRAQIDAGAERPASTAQQEHA